MYHIIDALQHLIKFKTLSENDLDGVTAYRNNCKPVALSNQVSFADYRFVILKAFPKDYFCSQNLERFSQIIY